MHYRVGREARRALAEVPFAERSDDAHGTVNRREIEPAQIRLRTLTGFPLSTRSLDLATGIHIPSFRISLKGS